MPPNTYGRIAARSGLAWNQHLSIGGGVIDGDYRGNVAMILFNHSDHDVRIMRGDKIAQLGRSGLSTWKYQFSYDH